MNISFHIDTALVRTRLETRKFVPAILFGKINLFEIFVEKKEYHNML